MVVCTWLYLNIALHVKKKSTKTFIGFASLMKKFERSTSCCLVSILSCPRYKWTTIFKQQKNFKYINSEIGFHVFYLIYLPVLVTGFFSLWIQFGPLNRNQWFFISTNINHIKHTPPPKKKTKKIKTFLGHNFSLIVSVTCNIEVFRYDITNAWYRLFLSKENCML